MGFELPEVGLLYNSPEEVESATAYVTRHAPDLLQMLGLAPAETVRITEPGVNTCSKGHEFNEANTIWRKDARGNYSRRRCRQCKNAYERGNRAKGA